MALTHLSLFSGIGGLDLAAEWAGFETVGQCEWADFPTKVLEKHWPNVPRWRDIRTLNGESFYERTGRRTVDVISGGFPCQPFSVAGNQKGKDDERYLWPEMLRVIRELTPRWVIGENVPGILHIAAADVVKDLERLGYHVVVFAFEAAAVGARHRRERIFFVANASSDGCVTGRDHREERRISNDTERDTAQGQPEGNGRIDRAGAVSATGAGCSMENTKSIRRRRSRNLCFIRKTNAIGIRKRAHAEPFKSSQISSTFSDTTRERCGEAREHRQRSEERYSCGGIIPNSEDENVSVQIGDEAKNAEFGSMRPVSNTESERRRERRTEPAREQGRFDAEFGGTSYANSNSTGLERRTQSGNAGGERSQADEQFAGFDREPASDTLRAGLPIAGQQSGQQQVPTGDGIKLGDWWATEPDVGRVAHGVPSRVDRLKCLGNAVVPQQAYPIFKAIADLENEQKPEGNKCQM